MASTVADHLLERLRDWGVDTVFGYPGDGINGLLAAWGRADDRPRFVQAGTRRWRRSRRSATPSSPAGSGSAWRPRGRARSTCSTGCTTPSSTTCRWWRSSGRPTAVAMGGVVPAGGRPAQPVQGRRERLRADGDRARAAARTCWTGRSAPRWPARPDRADHPGRRAGAGVLARRRTSSRWCPPASGCEWPTVAPDDAGRAPRRGRAQRRVEGRDAGRLRAPRGARAELEQVADLLGAGVAKALLGKDVLSDELP